jgi:3-hydroxyacyl-CoA dehydrogenase
MSGKVTSILMSEICVITLDNPPVNAMGTSMRKQIETAYRTAISDAAVKAIIITATGRLFSGGADIAEFQGEMGEPYMPALFSELETSPKLLIAALNGTTLGGGMELALACHARLAVEGAQLGLPEVNIGIIPGAGGTQRLPRLIGVVAALEIITSGKPISAKKALACGLIDVLVGPEDDLVTAAIAFATIRLKSGVPATNALNVPLATVPADPDFFATYRKGVQKAARGMQSPLKALDAVEASTRLSLSEGLMFENKVFNECNSSEQGRALQHIFFSERKVAHIKGLSPEIKSRPLNSVAIIGAGTMGGGIAMNFLQAGIPVTLLDINADGLERGLKTIAKNYEISASKGRYSALQIEGFMGLLTGTQNYADLGQADLIIEAAFEKMSIKSAIFKELDKVAKPGAILATNTSTLDVNEIAAVTSRPQDVIGLHFFSPANVMRLVEIVRGKNTSPEAIKTGLEMCKRLKKIGVVVGVCFGFVGNRMLEPYVRESLRLLLEGATPEAIDRVLTTYGLSMGPFAMSDLAGIDVGALVRGENPQNAKGDPTYGRIGDVMAKAGFLGQKSGRGYYIYEGRERTINPEVAALIEAEAKAFGITRREISDQEIFERCLYPLIDEGLLILEDDIAQRPGDIDIIWVNGYGYPAWRGGPMQWADEFGASKIHAALIGYRDSLGAYGKLWFNPSASLTKLAETNGKITDIFSNN